MSDRPGEKTEQPTPRRIDDARKKGQIARSPEVQTAFVLGAALLTLLITGPQTWHTLANSLASSLAHVHATPLSLQNAPHLFTSSALTLASCVAPLLLATTAAGLLAGGFQSRFRTAPEALTANWERISPVAGFKRLFSLRSAVPTALGLLKLTVIVALTCHVIRNILLDPIFSSTVDLSRVASFMASSSLKIFLRVLFALGVIASLDYAFQSWKNHQDLMMTRQELKDELKHSEGNPEVKAHQRRRRQLASKRRMLLNLPLADVVVTNPTHLAVALRYDRLSMKAPRIIAKGSRLNALHIREIALQHRIPILENKPLARLLFKHGRVDSDIPAQLYAAVAEVLAWVYRTNPYRYYRQHNLSS